MTLHAKWDMHRPNRRTTYSATKNQASVYMLNTFIALRLADVNYYGSRPDEQAGWDPRLGGISEHAFGHLTACLLSCVVLRSPGF